MTVRVSVTDRVEGGSPVKGVIAFARTLEARGCDAIHVSGALVRASQTSSALRLHEIFGLTSAK
ncbi:hypothetical protein [Methylocella sp.]|uniref:hypothetical protein n=1 Tax=Methylocella sp. TaxID=1978226 RepID=UPI003783DE34